MGGTGSASAPQDPRTPPQIVVVVMTGAIFVVVLEDSVAVQVVNVVWEGKKKHQRMPKNQSEIK
jgi:hypothetical protein